MKTIPDDDELEVTVFGPGYGESSVIHIGENKWIIVDSCFQSGTNKPAAIEYLKNKSVDVARDVLMVVITHWHDDHIRGASETVRQCKNARVCISSAFTTDEFVRFLAAHHDQIPSRLGTGVDELSEVLSEMRGRKGNQLGGQDKRLLLVDHSHLAHRGTCEVWSLSPSDLQLNESLAKFATLLPLAGTTKRRAVPTGKNDNSVALWISAGSDHLILGADLEQTRNPEAGWTSVLKSTNRPSGAVSLFKVPHHGSQNAHNGEIWTEILTKDVVAIVTPWNKSKKLPTESDVERLASLTQNLYITAPNSELRRVKHDSSTEKLIRDFGVRTYSEATVFGWVTARKKISSSEEWVVSSYSS